MYFQPFEIADRYQGVIDITAFLINNHDTFTNFDGIKF